jgi:proteic killer suppression protein
MIVTYRDRRTERFASGRPVKEFSGFSRQAEIRLDRPDAATSLADLAALPAIGSRRLKAIAPDNFRFESTINGGFVSGGRADHLALLT